MSPNTKPTAFVLPPLPASFKKKRYPSTPPETSQAPPVRSYAEDLLRETDPKYKNDEASSTEDIDVGADESQFLVHQYNFETLEEEMPAWEGLGLLSYSLTSARDLKKRRRGANPSFLPRQHLALSPEGRRHQSTAKQRELNSKRLFAARAEGVQNNAHVVAPESLERPEAEAAACEKQTLGGLDVASLRSNFRSFRSRSPSLPRTSPKPEDDLPPRSPPYAEEENLPSRTPPRPEETRISQLKPRTPVSPSETDASPLEIIGSLPTPPPRQLPQSPNPWTKDACPPRSPAWRKGNAANPWTPSESQTSLLRQTDASPLDIIGSLPTPSSARQTISQLKPRTPSSPQEPDGSHSSTPTSALSLSHFPNAAPHDGGGGSRGRGFDAAYVIQRLEALAQMQEDGWELVEYGGCYGGWNGYRMEEQETEEKEEEEKKEQGEIRRIDAEIRRGEAGLRMKEQRERDKGSDSGSGSGGEVFGGGW